MTEPLDPEGDATYLFNTGRGMAYESQKFMAQNTLEFLNSEEAAKQYKITDLIYMRGVWTRVDAKIEETYGPGSENYNSDN